MSVRRTVTMLSILMGTGCDGVMFRTGFDEVEDGLLYEAEELTDAPESVDQLVVVNYNIKYGGARLLFFWECNGTRYNMTQAEVTGHLDAIVEFIDFVDPDILMLQEVDRLSVRSAYVDQVQYLLDRTDLNYGAYASQHKADYLPSDGMGKMDFGNATLSRWPISSAERISLPLVEQYPGYYQYFYLKRHILDAVVEVPGVEDFHVVNTHLEAFSDDGTKEKQIDQFHGVLTDLTDSGATWIGGGDLNSLAAGTEQWSDFEDDCPGLFDPDDYSGEEDWLDDLFGDFDSVMSLDDYADDNSAWFSYTGDPEIGWTRTLDYLFTSGTWVDGEGMVMQSEEQGGYDTLPISDHAPVRAVMEVE